MAHLVENMCFVGDRPWHSIGSQLDPHQPLEVWQKQSGISFDIKEAPVRFLSEEAGSLGSIHSFPDNKVLYRSDTKAPLAVVSARYQVVQPKEILEFYRDLTEISGYQLETAGVLKGGKKIWALAKTGQSAALKGNDVMNGYVLLATACDGTLATTAQFTSVRVVCNNTLGIALSNGTGAVKVPHSTTFDPQAVKKELGIAVSSWDEFIYRMKLLSERKVGSSEAMAYFPRVFGDSSSERILKKVHALFEGQGKGAELASSHGTAFGLLNAVTQFIDHERRSKSEDHRRDSAWLGVGAQVKQRAFDQAMLLAA